MLKTLFTVVIMGIFSTAAYSQNPVQGFGEWWKGFKFQFDLDSKRNHATPQPFASQDQRIVQQSFASMYHRGNMLGRVLGSVHFDEKTNELNNAGRTQLQQILAQQKPMNIFLASTLDPKVDRTRQEKLKALLANYSFPGHRPDVETTFYLPHLRMATDYADIQQKYMNGQPVPTLKSVSGQISGSTRQ